jgi:hypothetical protein
VDQDERDDRGEEGQLTSIINNVIWDNNIMALLIVTRKVAIGSL